MLLTRMIQQHYEKPVILLIDEYDVPVAKANNNGYYNEMLDVMKGLMQALKDNPALRFAVVTGCLKIAKGASLREPIILYRIRSQFSSQRVFRLRTERG